MRLAQVQHACVGRPGQRVLGDEAGRAAHHEEADDDHRHQPQRQLPAGRSRCRAAASSARGSPARWRPRSTSATMATTMPRLPDLKYGARRATRCSRGGHGQGRPQCRGSGRRRLSRRCRIRRPACLQSVQARRASTELWPRAALYAPGTAALTNNSFASVTRRTRPASTPPSWPRRRFLGALAAAAAAPARAVPRRDHRRRRHADAGGHRRPSATRTSRRCRWPPSCAPTSSAAACSACVDAPGGFDETAAASACPTGAAAAPTRWLVGSVTRLADGRFDVRFKLWDVVKGERPGRPEPCRAAGRPAPGGAPRRRLDLPEPDRRARRVLHAHRLRHARRPAAITLHVTDADGEGGQIALASPEPDHLAGLVAQRQANWPTCPSRARRPWSGCRTWPPASAAWWPTSAAPTARRPGRPTAATWRVTLSRDGGSQLYLMSRDGGTPRRLTQQLGHRHRAGVHARRPADLLRQRPRRRPADLPHAASAAATPSASPSRAATTSARRSAPTAACWPTSRARAAAFKLMVQDLAGGTPQALTDTSDDESPSFAPNGRLLVYATPRRRAATC